MAAKRASQRQQPAAHPLLGRVAQLARGVARQMLPQARGVYHPHAGSRVLLGVALPPDADVETLSGKLWWRGLGIVERDGQLIAGADVDGAVRLRRLKHARVFVTRQLRDAGVRGSVKRWS